MDYEFKRTLKVKADKVWVEELQAKKADVSMIEQLIERMNKFEELLQQKTIKAAQAATEKEKGESESGEEKEEKEEEDDDGSPSVKSPDSSTKKKAGKRNVREVDSEDEARAEEARKKAEEA